MIAIASSRNAPEQWRQIPFDGGTRNRGATRLALATQPGRKLALSARSLFSYFNVCYACLTPLLAR